MDEKSYLSVEKSASHIPLTDLLNLIFRQTDARCIWILFNFVSDPFPYAPFELLSSHAICWICMFPVIQCIPRRLISVKLAQICFSSQLWNSIVSAIDIVQKMLHWHNEKLSQPTNSGQMRKNTVCIWSHIIRFVVLHQLSHNHSSE